MTVERTKKMATTIFGDGHKAFDIDEKRWKEPLGDPHGQLVYELIIRTQRTEPWVYRRKSKNSKSYNHTNHFFRKTQNLGSPPLYLQGIRWKKVRPLRKQIVCLAAYTQIESTPSSTSRTTPDCPIFWRPRCDSPSLFLTIQQGKQPFTKKKPESFIFDGEVAGLPTFIYIIT